MFLAIRPDVCAQFHTLLIKPGSSGSVTLGVARR
jgi:hypothetical protein